MIAGWRGYFEWFPDYSVEVNDVFEDGERLALSVEDNGRGIKEEEFRGGRSLGFLGLRERAQAFGGSIDVQGSEGKGTRVDVSIPLALHEQVFHA